jgi:trehalose-phosphatase
MGGESVMIFGSEEYLEQILNAEKLRLFLDYDGTLADFAPTPDEVYPDQELIHLLQRIKNKPNIQAAVISGRRLSHIQKLIPLTGIWLAGTYGIELFDPTGKHIFRLEHKRIRPTLEMIKPQWQAIVKSQPELFLEDKAWSLALHAKNVDPSTADIVLQQAKNIIKENDVSNEDFRILGGHKFIEIAPRLANKGLTIDYLLNHNPLDGSLPIFIGDDDKDEEAFEAILNNNGLAIKVCNQPCTTKAQLRIENPNKVRQFLTSLLTSG